MRTSHEGLSSSQVTALKLKYGNNILPSEKSTPKVILFLSQFKSILVILLFFAAAVSIFLNEIIDAIFIIAIIFLNASIGFFQELKAKNELAALKKLVTTNARVIRDGKELLINTSEIVPGDLIVITDGDKIPADAKLLESKNLKISEAALTGESVPVEKEIGDSIFMSTVVLSGRALATVETIGQNTRFGQIAVSLREISDEKTPLEIQISKIGWKLTAFVILIITVVFFLSWDHFTSLKDVFLSSVALAVAAIPEGLPAVLTIALAVGVSRLSKQKAIVKRLVATESLGSVDVICTDKTGTLTKNEMTVVEIVNVKKEHFKVNGVGYNQSGTVDNWQDNAINRKLIECAMLCNSSSLALVEDDGSFQVLGDTTEGALLVLGKKINMDYEDLRLQKPVVEEIPFDSQRRLMTVAVSNEVFSKGAPEEIFKLVTNLNDSQKEDLRKEAAALGLKGFRVLGLAHKSYKSKISLSQLETNLEFLGLIAIFDPPREEVVAAFNACRESGIRVIMLTGDSPETARAVGEQTGLILQGDEIISGEQLEQYSDEVLLENIARVAIVSRASPLDKLRIVSALQDSGKIVAVTGDGVNDAPALKKAQIGVAMGITGTDVAKESADLIITDDNFSTIVSAIEEGRIIYLNLSRAIIYLLSCNLGEILTVTLALIFSFPLPLSPLAILWMNLVTDGLPALALAIDPAKRTVLKSTKEKIGINSDLLNPKNLRIIILLGSVLAFISLMVYIPTLKTGLGNARIMTFSILVIGELLIAYILRGRQKVFSNKLLFFSTFFGIVCQILIIVNPMLTDLFS